jgi:hypothetical protein
MTKQDCIARIRKTVHPNALETAQVDWKTLFATRPEAFNGNTFLNGIPFVLICPDSVCENPDVFLKKACQCQDAEGNTLADCYPKAASYPLRSTVHVDPELPSAVSAARTENSYALSCYCCCGQVTGSLSDEAGSDRSSPVTTAEEPTNLQLAGRLGKSMLNWGRTGFTTVTDELYAKRLAACAGCDQLREAPDRLAYKVSLKKGEDKRTCAACGCVVSRKAKLPKDTCPLQDPENPVMNRWGEPWRLRR